MNDYLKQSELSYFFPQHSMNNANNAAKQAPSLYARPKDDDSVFGGVWVQPEEEARKSALSITGTEIWGPRPQFPLEKSWDGKSGSSGSGRMSTTETEGIDRWTGQPTPSDWNRRSNMSSSSEASQKETPPPLMNDTNFFMPLFNRPPDPKLPPAWRNFQQPPQQAFQPLTLHQLQQQQQQMLQQKQLLFHLLQQKKLQGGGPLPPPPSQAPSSLFLDPQWLPSNHPKKLLDPVTADVYKKIANHLNPSQQAPQTRSKMIQQLVSMGFKRDDVGKTLMENDLDYDLTLGELFYKSTLSQGFVNTQQPPQHQQPQQAPLFVQQQQQQQQILQQYLRSLANNMQQQQQQQQRPPPLLSMLNNIRNMSPFPSNQVPVDYTVQSLMSSCQKNFPTSPSAFFQPPGNNNNSNISSLFAAANSTHNILSNGISNNNRNNMVSSTTTPLLNPQSPEWTPSRPADAPTLTSLINNMTLSSPTWRPTPTTSTDHHKPPTTQQHHDDDTDLLNESSHYWLPADLTQNSATLEEETPSAWIAINNLPEHVSKDLLAVVLCQYGSLKSLSLIKESNYALVCFQDKQQAVLARSELNSSGLQGNTRVQVEFVADWTLETPTFQSSLASLPAAGTEEEEEEGGVGGKVGGTEDGGGRSEMGYTTPGGLWIPNKPSTTEYFFGEFHRTEGHFNGGGADDDDDVLEGRGLVGGGADDDDDVVQDGAGGLSGGLNKQARGFFGGGSGVGVVGRGGFCSRVVNGAAGVAHGQKKGGQGAFRVDKFGLEDGEEKEVEEESLDFLFDKPYEGPLNKTS